MSLENHFLEQLIYNLMMKPIKKRGEMLTYQDSILKSNNMKALTFFLAIFFCVYNLTAQKIFEDKNLKISAYFNLIDSSLNIKFENKSDSLLIFNGDEPYYYEVDDLYYTHFILYYEGAGIIGPSDGEIISIKHLYPKKSFTINISAKNTNIDDLKKFDLKLKLNYLQVSKNHLIEPKILVSQLKSIVKNKKTKVLEKTRELNIKLIDKSYFISR